MGKGDCPLFSFPLLQQGPQYSLASISPLAPSRFLLITEAQNPGRSQRDMRREGAQGTKSSASRLQDRRKSEQVGGQPPWSQPEGFPGTLSFPGWMLRTQPVLGPLAQGGSPLSSGALPDVRSARGSRPGARPTQTSEGSPHGRRRPEGSTYLSGRCRCPCLRSALCLACPPACCALQEARRPGHGARRGGPLRPPAPALRRLR